MAIGREEELFDPYAEGSKASEASQDAVKEKAKNPACPISFVPFTSLNHSEIVGAPDGRFYQKSAIEQWMAKKEISPFNSAMKLSKNKLFVSPAFVESIEYIKRMKRKNEQLKSQIEELNNKNQQLMLEVSEEKAKNSTLLSKFSTFKRKTSQAAQYEEPKKKKVKVNVR